jgi:hypothetical protein
MKLRRTGRTVRFTSFRWTELGILGLTLTTGPVSRGTRVSTNRCCWAQSLGGCDGLSKEHVFSRAAFRQRPRSKIRVVGFTPIPDGPIGPDSPKAKVLCGNHNSSLSILDSEIAKVTEPILDFYNDRADRSLTVSGALFERWLFKVAINFMAAGYAEMTRWAAEEELVRFVFGQIRLQPPRGMYMLREWDTGLGPPPEHMGVRPIYFGYSPADSELVGAVVTYHGISFLACMDARFEDLLASRSAAFPIRPDILSFHPAAAVVYSKSAGSQFRLNFEWP